MSQSLVAIFSDRTRCFPYWATVTASGAKVEMPFAKRIQVNHPLEENPTTPHSQELSCNEHDPNKLSQRPLRNQHRLSLSEEVYHRCKAEIWRAFDGILGEIRRERRPILAPTRRVCTKKARADTRISSVGAEYANVLTYSYFPTPARQA